MKVLLWPVKAIDLILLLIEDFTAIDMKECKGNSDFHSTHSPETQPLLSRFARYDGVYQQKLASISVYLQRCFLTSKAIVLILLWTMLIGAVYHATIGIILLFLIHATPVLLLGVSVPFVILYSFIVFVFIFYPVSGFIADVYCGRFRMIATSLSVILLSLISFLSFFMVFFYVSVPNDLKPFLFVVLGLALFLSLLGIGGYSANVIQFGLDQLIDAPSQHQAYFVHWSKWSYDALSIVIVGLFAYYTCPINDVTPGVELFVLPNAICIGLLSVLLIFSFWKRHWFHAEPGQHNPYKMVVKVLNFARKNKYPLRRSAFTYCDDERPSRLDFAKERFGGPFTTEQVEDVKTLFRILVLLLAIGPVFVMDVPSSNVAFMKVGLHIGSYQSKQSCSWDWIIVNSGLMHCIVYIIFLPVYVIFLQRYTPRVFVRVGFGIIVFLLGILSVLAVDIAGHVHDNKNNTMCIFSTHLVNGTFVYPHLDLHWSYLVVPNVLLGIGPSIVTVSIFEFISAQSPHSMKGLLLRAFFTITGIFQFLGSIAIIPFAMWTKDTYHPGISCLFGYLTLIILVALIGFVLFFVMAKRYRYRERDDRPYDQRFVIDVYNRYLNKVGESEESHGSSID